MLVPTVIPTMITLDRRLWLPRRFPLAIDPLILRSVFRRALALRKPKGKVPFVMFPVGEIDLAIPIATVAKVVNLGAVKGRDQSPWGVTALGNQPYTVLDLHHYLFQTPLAPSPQGGYLVLIYLATGELVGIPTVCTPTLVEVCWDQVRFLPAAYRKADRLAVASHMARWTDPETQADHFLFVLDISALSAL
jgi:chemotaxis signal transduction protein